MQTRMRAISRFDRQAMELWPQILKDIESCAVISRRRPLGLSLEALPP